MFRATLKSLIDKHARLVHSYVLSEHAALIRDFRVFKSILFLVLNKGLWTMSDMVKYRAALLSFLKLTALVFYHV